MSLFTYVRADQTVEKRAVRRSEKLAARLDPENAPTRGGRVVNVYSHSRRYSHAADRLLATSLGKPWSEIYSKLVSMSKPNERWELEQWLRCQVRQDVLIVDNAPMTPGRKHALDRLWTRTMGYPTYYIHPDSQLLCLAPLWRRPAVKVADARLKEARKVDGVLVAKHCGCWFELRLKEMPGWCRWNSRPSLLNGLLTLKELRLCGVPFDSLTDLPVECTGGPSGALVQLYGSDRHYSELGPQLNTKKLKAFGLSND